MMQLEFTFINEHGQSYTWRPDYKQSDKVLQAAKSFKKKIDAVHVGILEDHETSWECKNEPKLVEKRKRVQKKRDNKPKARTPQPVNTSKKKVIRKKNWLVTPREFETVSHPALVKRLKKYYYEGGDRDIFLAYLRLMKLIYRADFLTVDRLIDPKDFYHEVKEIYSTTEPWSKQMMAALSDFRFMFDREEWSRLNHRWQNQNQALKKRQKELDLQETPEAADEETADQTEQTDSTGEEENPDKNETKRPNKALRHKFENFKNKGNKPKKKKRGFWF